MRRIVVLCGVLLCIALLLPQVSISNPLKIQRALQKLIVLSKSSDDLNEALFRFILFGKNEDAIAQLESYLSKQVLLHASKQRGEMLLEALRDLKGLDGDIVLARFRELGSTAKEMAKDSFLFPRLLEVAGLSRREITFIFEETLGHPPKVNTLRLSELGNETVAQLESIKFSNIFFQSGKYKVIPNPPVTGLKNLSYRGIIVLDDEGKIVARLPMDKARAVNPDFSQAIDDLFKRASDVCGTNPDAERIIKTVTHGAEAQKPVAKIAFERGKINILGKNLNSAEMRNLDGTTTSFRLYFDKLSGRIDYNSVVWAETKGTQTTEAVMNWNELHSLLNNATLFTQLKDYLLSQRVTEIFKRRAP